MSDDFAVCNSCGKFDASSKDIEECKFDMITAIFEQCIANQFHRFKDIEPEITELMEQYTQIVDAEASGKTGICLECGSYTTFMWQHVNYSESKTLDRLNTYGVYR